VKVTRRRLMPRLLDALAGSLLLGLGLFLLGGNLDGVVRGSYPIDTGEAAFLGFIALICGSGAFLLYLSVRGMRDQE
jgi:hypothetical protein